MRVYLAATVDQLRRLWETSGTDEETEGFAATPELRSALGQLGDDELEFALAVAAAEASAAMGGVGRVEPSHRRVVLVADVDDARVRPDRETPGAVVVGGRVSLSDVVAVLTDPPGTAARARPGDELSWFATQEIGDLLA